MGAESLIPEQPQGPEIGERRTRSFLQEELGCIPHDLTSWPENEPVICVIPDTMRTPEIFKRGETQFGLPHFIIFYGAENPAIFSQSGVRQSSDDRARLGNKGKAALCSISTTGDINIWRKEGENRVYNMPASTIFRPPNIATASPDAVARWEKLLTKIEQQAHP
jgi:hypothetical protein